MLKKLIENTYFEILHKIQNTTFTSQIESFIKTTILAIFIYIISSQIRKFFLNYGNRFKDARDSFFNLLGDIIYFISIFSIIMMYFNVFGINIKTIIAGMGLTGFILGMALKDIFSNLASGIMILISKPFNPGDLVEIGGKSGRLLEINLRHVILENEGEIIMIPASKVFSTHIIIKEKGTNK